MKKCSRCKTTFYCSRDCQIGDWKIHKRICGKEKEKEKQCHLDRHEVCLLKTTFFHQVWIIRQLWNGVTPHALYVAMGMMSTPSKQVNLNLL